MYQHAGAVLSANFILTTGRELPKDGDDTPEKALLEKGDGSREAKAAEKKQKKMGKDAKKAAAAEAIAKAAILLDKEGGDGATQKQTEKKNKTSKKPTKQDKERTNKTQDNPTDNPTFEVEGSIGQAGQQPEQQKKLKRKHKKDGGRQQIAPATNVAAESGEPPACAAASEVFQAVDSDGSGSISFEEFSRWWSERQLATMGKLKDNDTATMAQLSNAWADADHDQVMCTYPG